MFEDKILDAVDIIVKKRIEDAQLDKVIVGTVKGYDEEKDIYLVEYMNSTFTAKSITKEIIPAKTSVPILLSAAAGVRIILG